MKLLICAIVTVVTLLSVSMSTAVALPHHPHEAPKGVKSGSPSAAASAGPLLKSDEVQVQVQAKISELTIRAGPYGEEYDRYYAFAQADYPRYLHAFSEAFTDISGMCEATQGFNASYAKEIKKLAAAAGNRYSHEIEPGLYFEINEDTSMAAIAIKINNVITHGAETVDSFKRSIYRLIGKENPDVLRRAEGIYAIAEEIMNVAFNPTIEYLEPFFPTQ